MVKIACCFLLASGLAFGQTQPSPEQIKKDLAALQNSVGEVIHGTVPGWGTLQTANGSYLEGYGLVVTVEVAFETPRNPFSGLKSPENVRSTVNQRSKDVLEKLTNVLKQRVPGLNSLAATESAAVILYVLNTNPADLPDLASHIVLSVKKQDAASGRISIKEYK